MIDPLPEDLWEQAERAARKACPRNELDQALFTSSFMIGFLWDKVNELVDELNSRQL